MCFKKYVNEKRFLGRSKFVHPSFKSFCSHAHCLSSNRSEQRLEGWLPQNQGNSELNSPFPFLWAAFWRLDVKNLHHSIYFTWNINLFQLTLCNDAVVLAQKTKAKDILERRRRQQLLRCTVAILAYIGDTQSYSAALRFIEIFATEEDCPGLLKCGYYSSLLSLFTNHHQLPSRMFFKLFCLCCSSFWVCFFHKIVLLTVLSVLYACMFSSDFKIKPGRIIQVSGAWQF